MACSIQDIGFACCEYASVGGIINAPMASAALSYLLMYNVLQGALYSSKLVGSIRRIHDFSKKDLAHPIVARNPGVQLPQKLVIPHRRFSFKEPSTSSR